MERILVAVDGSEAALKAVDFAAKLAAQTKAELTIVTVVDEAYVGDRALEEFARAEHFKPTWSDLSEARATEILIAAHERAAVHKVTHVLKEWRTGNPAAQIVRYASDQRVDLIVVGHVGHSRFAGAILGSVAFKLLGVAPCPLTIVR
jgi:nucleotide-binding universal stress UspA family protein